MPEAPQAHGAAEKNLHVAVRLPKSVKEELDACAIREDITVSQILRKLVKQYLAEQKKRKQ